MPDFPFDFAVLIAYFLPGFILLASLRPAAAGVEKLFNRLNQDHSTGAMVTILVLSIALGMVVNPARTALLDRTSSLDLSWMREDEKSLKPIEKRYPDYSRLKEEGALNAFLLAERNDGNAYQFYGNTFIALLIFGIVRLACLGRKPWPVRPTLTSVVLAILFLAGFFLMYFAYRAHLCHFADAVEAIGATRVYR